jgi:hypothetical protein
VVSAPGRPATDPVAWAPELRQGNLLLVVGDEAQAVAARALARDVAGADYSPALRASGQAIRVVRLAACAREGCDLDPPATGASGSPVNLMAYAHDRTLAADRAGDPALRTFLEYWLGRAGG